MSRPASVCLTPMFSCAVLLQAGPSTTALHSRQPSIGPELPLSTHAASPSPPASTAAASYAALSDAYLYAGRPAQPQPSSTSQQAPAKLPPPLAPVIPAQPAQAPAPRPSQQALPAAAQAGPASLPASSTRPAWAVGSRPPPLPTDFPPRQPSLAQASPRSREAAKAPVRESKQDSQVLDRSALRASLPRHLYSPMELPTPQGSTGSQDGAGAEPEQLSRRGLVSPSRAKLPPPLEPEADPGGSVRAAPGREGGSAHVAEDGVLHGEAERPLPSSFSTAPLPWEASARPPKPASISGFSQQVGDSDGQAGTGMGVPGGAHNLHWTGYQLCELGHLSLAWL